MKYFLFLTSMALLSLGMIACTDRGQAVQTVKTISQPSTDRIEVYIDEEMGISCMQSAYTNNGISCVKKIMTGSNFTKVSIDRLERYIDKPNMIVCYQSAYTNNGISCLEVDKLPESAAGNDLNSLPQ